MLESCCFWLIKSCVCSKFLHFLSVFGTTEGIRTLLIVYSLAVLYFVEGNLPSSCQHPWSQRTPQSCQGNSFCLGSCKRERDRNVLWRTKGFCCRAQKHVWWPFTANTVYGWVRESRSYSQCKIMRWSFWEQHPDVHSGLESQARAGLLFSVFVLLCKAILKYWHKSSGFRLLGWKGSLVLFTPRTFSKQSFLFEKKIIIHCSRRVSIGIITNWIPVWSCSPLLGDLLLVLDKPYSEQGLQLE